MVINGRNAKNDVSRNDMKTSFKNENRKMGKQKRMEEKASAGSSLHSRRMRKEKMDMKIES
jgi:hypothetical protein